MLRFGLSPLVLPPRLVGKELFLEALELGVLLLEPGFLLGKFFAAVCFGMLAYFLIPRMPSLFWKWVIVLAAVLTMLFVGFSRVYENGHYLSDVLAGYALGLAWGALVYTVFEFFVIRRRV